MEAHVTSDPGGYSLVVYAGHGCNGSQSHTCIHVQILLTQTHTHHATPAYLPSYIPYIHTHLTTQHHNSHLCMLHMHTNGTCKHMKVHIQHENMQTQPRATTPIPTCINLNVESTYVRENTWCLSLWFSFLNIAISSPTLSWKCHDLTFSYSCIDSILS